MYDTIEQIIDAFFEGKDSFETHLGFAWVAKHGKKRIKKDALEDSCYWMTPPIINSYPFGDPDWGYINEFETLTLEPLAGGQYELAVRIWSEKMWRGYQIHNFDHLHFLVGRHTRGH